VKPKTFLAKHDYIVQVHKTPEGCAAIFPKTTPKTSKSFVNYLIVRSDPPCVIINKDFYYSPTYVLRLLVMCDIINRMTKINLHQSLISYYDNENEVSELSYLLKCPEKTEDCYKEGFLLGLLNKAIEDNFPLIYDTVAFSEHHDVGVGYRLLRGFF
jgi:hypothetical protein